MIELKSDVQFTEEALSLNDIVTQLGEKMGDEISANKLTLNLDLDEDLLSVYGDRQYLEKALWQILDNAICFSDEDGAITIRTYPEDEHAIVEIEDEGVGIEGRLFSYIFTDFWQADDASAVGGLGIGLPIAKKIIDHHKGLIEVESQLEKGSIFRVIVPVNEQWS